jgi:NTE family protein
MDSTEKGKSSKHYHVYTEPEGMPVKGKYKLGLALCGGAALGVSQVGVLKALEKEGIEIDCLAGTSSGAITAAAYASGLPVSEIEKLGKNASWRELYSLRPSLKGLVSSGPIEQYIRKHLKVSTFEELKKPLAVVAADICSGEEVIFTKGPLDKAIRASCSIPGIYGPSELDGRQLVDGGLSENVPVRALKGLGADIVIAVNVFGRHKVFPPASNVLQILMRVWYFFVEQDTSWREYSDVVIEPDLRLYDLYDFGDAAEIIAAGEKETARQLPEIQKVIEHRSVFWPETYS